MQGWRTDMEDAHFAGEELLGPHAGTLVFGVFDGHGGREVASYAASRFTSTLAGAREGPLPSGLETTFARLEHALHRSLRRGQRRQYRVEEALRR